MQNFATFLKVILTKHAQNESNLPCQNALKLTYGNVKIKNFSGATPGPPLTGKGTEGEVREAGASTPLKPWSKCSIEKVGGNVFSHCMTKVGGKKKKLLSNGENEDIVIKYV